MQGRTPGVGCSMQRAASGECGRPCVGGSGSPAKGDYAVPPTPHDAGSEKGEPRGVTEFRNESMVLYLTVAERSLASNCTRRCTAPSVVAKVWFRRADDVRSGCGIAPSSARKVEGPRGYR